MCEANFEEFSQQGYANIPNEISIIRGGIPETTGDDK